MSRNDSRRVRTPMPSRTSKTDLLTAVVVADQSLAGAAARLENPDRSEARVLRPFVRVSGSALRQFEKVNEELWLLLSMFAIALLLNVVTDAQRTVLSFYTLPTLAAAYLYGRRHATLTAFGSVLIVILMAVVPAIKVIRIEGPEAWLDLAAWGGMLLVTAYLMGTLCDFKEEMRKHVEHGISTLETVGGSLRRVIPIVLAHHDKFDGSGHHATAGENIPLEARIITAADVYDSLTSDRPYRKAMSPFDAKGIIVKGQGTDFDPKVVEAFLVAFRNGEMDVRTPVAA